MHMLRRDGSGGGVKVALVILAVVVAAGVALAVAVLSERQSAQAQEASTGGAGYQVTDLGTLPGGAYSRALGINSRGQVVGFSHIASNTSHAFLWEDGVMTDLNNLVGDVRDLVLETAIAITDAGQIVGVALVGDQHHLFNAFLLTPAT